MVLVINLAVWIKLKRKKKIWSTYLQSVLAFYPKQTKENYPQFTKLDALVVLQQHFMFHRSHRRMCGSSDSYKHFTDKVQNGCSPPDNWLGKQQHDWWWTGLEKTRGHNFMLLQILKQQAKKKKNSHFSCLIKSHLWVGENPVHANYIMTNKHRFMRFLQAMHSIFSHP